MERRVTIDDMAREWAIWKNRRWTARTRDFTFDEVVDFGRLCAVKGADAMLRTMRDGATNARGRYALCRVDVDPAAVVEEMDKEGGR